MVNFYYGTRKAPAPEVEPEYIDCVIKTCDESIPAAYGWQWGECAACKLKACPDCLQKIDEELFCTSCAEYEKPEAKAA